MDQSLVLLLFLNKPIFTAMLFFSFSGCFVCWKSQRDKKKMATRSKWERYSLEFTAMHHAESCLVLHQREEERLSKNLSSFSVLAFFFPQLKMSSGLINFCTFQGGMLFVCAVFLCERNTNVLIWHTASGCHISNAREIVLVALHCAV